MKYVVVVPYTVQSIMNEFMATCKLENVLQIDNTTNNIGCMASHNLGVDKMYETESDWLVVISAAIRFGEPGGLDFIEKLKLTYPSIEYLKKGSALKFFDLAEGKADIYPRFAPTMEWDIAAGQAILEALGGSITSIESGQKLVYNKKNLFNPHFIALTKPTASSSFSNTLLSR